MYYYSDEVMTWMKDKLKEREEFGFQYVDYGDPDDLIPGFPSVIITDNPKQRILAGTHQFGVNLSVDLWVLHADGKVGASQRRLDNIKLCNQIEDFLDLNMNLPDEANLTIADKNNNPGPFNIIQGWISGESPGVLRRKGSLIVATRMTWDGVTRKPFS